jgi:hypothetical protein
MRVCLSFVSPKQVASSPRRWLAISGATFLAAVIIGGSLQLGDITLPPIASTSRQVVVGLLGAVLIFASFVMIEGAGPPPQRAGILADPDFWSKVFDAMPPAFIKEYPSDGHLADNEAFRT